MNRTSNRVAYDPSQIAPISAEVKQDLVNSIGGKLEGFYFSFGVSDVIVIVDVPDNVSAAAASLVVNATGAVKLKTTVLLTPEEMDAATKKTANYRPPG